MKRLVKAFVMAKTRWKNFAVPSMLVIAVALCLARSAYAASREYQVKAAFIYNFTQFIEWPKDAFSSPDAPFVIAIVGDDPFDGALDKILASKSVGSRPIVTRHFGSVGDIGPCQILFVSTTADTSLRAVVEKTGNAPVLTVGESEELLSAGGAVRLFLEDGKMRFQINPDVLEAARLKASAKLMQLARIYKK
jgi:hypothetical protein